MTMTPEAAVEAWRGSGRVAIKKLDAQSENRLLRQRLRRAEREAARCETLLHEGDHRIKNSLQIVASLMRVQASREETVAAADALNAAATRVLSIAQIHDALQESGGKDVIDLGGALLAMCRSLHTMAGGPRTVALVVNVEPIRAPVALAQPLLLAVNELVVNALRHAFPDGRPGAIEIKANIIGDELVVVVADDGVGMPVNSDEPRGFGSKLIKMMTAKIDATLVLDATQGVRFTITAPAPQVLADIEHEAEAEAI
ncbi:MAG: sensor histidine kinase [Hyphomonadaceae bacterium]|nr:sensor histidine kinase [Hyphomonadaceae bacterium]